MKLTTKMRYGTRAMLDLALHQERGPVALKDIAQRQEVSAKYMERLLAALQGANLVKTVRGRRGGYTLSRPPEQINLREIYDVLEGADGFVDCTIDPQSCHRSATCVTQEVWAQLCAACMRILEETTLADLVQRAQQKQEASMMYYI